jgi:hypothetical protein
MANLDLVRQKYIYLVVLALLALMGAVICLYQSQAFTYNDARVYLEALTGIATLALLYFAYFNVISKKNDDAARLELAVRPILIWELEGVKGKALLSYKTIKHPIYDFCAKLSAGGKELTLDERHLDVFEANPSAARQHDITGFVRGAMGGKGARTLSILFTYHSEAGGKYELAFTKEIALKGGALSFAHRKIISAKYPWREQAVRFD